MLNMLNPANVFDALDSSPKTIRVNFHINCGMLNKLMLFQCRVDSRSWVCRLCNYVCDSERHGCGYVTCLLENRLITHRDQLAP